MSENPIEQRVLANAIRFLSIDAIEKANSGHPGLPMGFADVATVLFLNHLEFDPKKPDWPNRDRFVLSAGHGSMLLYSLLYLLGYEDMTKDELRSFRRLGSKTPGHPEYFITPGIETTTGPLGQGVANAVGMAISERILNSRLGDSIINHFTYVVAGDGCLMEGISHEASSLAGHLGLSKLIMFFDNNGISIDGSISLTNSEKTLLRYESLNWHVQEVDGHNPKAIDLAICNAKLDNRPSFISCKTIIGYGAPNKQGSSGIHGAPLGKDEIINARQLLNWKNEPFDIPDDILKIWRSAGQKGSKNSDLWDSNFKLLNSEKKKLLENAEELDLNSLNKIINTYKKTVSKKMPSIATRKASQEVLEIFCESLSNLIGGSADLTGSNNTKVNEMDIISKDSFNGTYIHYGVREHAMAGVMNGIALHGNLIPYGGTFLVFSDYLRPSLRLSSLMKQQVIYVLSHDSIGLGEDGPTHQPIEHLASLRAIPNLLVFRPADAIETAECWALAIHSKNSPSIIALTRQNLDTLRVTHDELNLCKFGAYEVSSSEKKPSFSILSSGSEVSIAIRAKEILEEEGIYSRVVSFPCHELFDLQSDEYKKEILQPDTKKIAIEAGIKMSWDKYLKESDHFIGIETFGESAPYKDLYDYFNINVDKILSIVRDKT
ncbi:MAG: Transketolase 2 [Alphaproteobacteria bacterium MarineAlpha2_Bin1]|nr:MAG: Transketolase 2 [Alphaproteobacteria bacterium MarineAlpha2_Bin1]